MSRFIHQLVLYGVGSVTFFTLGFATERNGAAAPFIARVNLLPEPPRSSVFDQRTLGGQGLGGERFCTAQTRLLIQSDLPLAELQAHYDRSPVDPVHGKQPVRGKVLRLAEVKNLVAEWQKHRRDGKIYVVEFVSPGSPGTAAVCGL